MTVGSLVTRLNFKYPRRDLLNAIRGISRGHPNYGSLYSLFGTMDIFFANHGRTGLRISLTALELPARSRIGVSTYNCQTVFQAIKASGHIPVFIDINRDLRIDISSLEKQSKCLDALIVTHLFGLGNDINEIRRIVPNIPVIEDCAHAFLSGEVHGYTGTSGDFGIFSIGKGKFPSIGDGGVILVNNKKYLDITRKLTYQLTGNSLLDELLNISRNILLSIAHKPFIYGIITYPLFKRVGVSSYQNDGFRERAILNSNLNVFLNSIDYYRKVAVQQEKNAKNNLEVLFWQAKLSPAFHIIRCSNWNYFMQPVLSEKRDLIIDNAKKNGYELGRHFSKSVDWAGQYGYRRGDCPMSEYVAENIITIPTYYKMKMRNESND